MRTSGSLLAIESWMFLISARRCEIDRRSHFSLWKNEPLILIGSAAAASASRSTHAFRRGRTVTNRLPPGVTFAVLSVLPSKLSVVLRYASSRPCMALPRTSLTTLPARNWMPFGLVKWARLFVTHQLTEYEVVNWVCFQRSTLASTVL